MPGSSDAEPETLRVRRAREGARKPKGAKDRRSPSGASGGRPGPDPAAEPGPVLSGPSRPPYRSLEDGWKHPSESTLMMGRRAPRLPPTTATDTDTESQPICEPEAPSRSRV